MPHSKLLTMDRQGDFRIRAVGPNHCGVVNDLQIKYQMVCICDDILDSRGFLFDQINIDNFFQGIKRSSLSCERLTISCAQKLRRLIREENPSCRVRRIKLTLSPQPFLASMTYEWKA